MTHQSSQVRRLACCAALTFVLLTAGWLLNPGSASAHSRTAQSPQASCSSWYTIAEDSQPLQYGFYADVSLKGLYSGGSYCGKVQAVDCITTPSRTTYTDIVMWQEFYVNNNFVQTQRYYFTINTFTSKTYCITGPVYSVPHRSNATEVMQADGSEATYLGSASVGNTF